MAEPTRSAVVMRVHAAGATDIGKGRTHNADAVLLRPDLHLFAVADGTGGSGGNVASALATASIANFFNASEKQSHANVPDVDAYGLFTGARRLAAAVQKANHDIVEIAKTSNKHRGMGSTIVVASLSPEPGLMHLVHVGDSRAYRLRHGLLEQLTIDHSLLHDVLELRPEIDDESLAQLPENVVTRALGMKEGLRVTSQTLPIVSGDRYLLCSDGLSDVLSEEAIRETLSMQRSAEEIVRLLIRMANDAGGKDNIAAIVFACEVPPGAGFRAKRVAPRATKRAAVPDSRQDRVSHYEQNPEVVIRELDSGELEEIEEEPTRQNKTVQMNPQAAGKARAQVNATLQSRSPSSTPGKMKTPRPNATMRLVRCPKCQRALDAGQLCPQCGVPRAGGPKR